MLRMDLDYYSTDTKIASISGDGFASGDSEQSEAHRRWIKACFRC